MVFWVAESEYEVDFDVWHQGKKLRFLKIQKKKKNSCLPLINTTFDLWKKIVLWFSHAPFGDFSGRHTRKNQFVGDKGEVCGFVLGAKKTLKSPFWRFSGRHIRKNQFVGDYCEVCGFVLGAKKTLKKSFEPSKLLQVQMLRLL